MDRRELLKMIAVLTGGAVVGAEAFLTGCKNPETKTGMAFSEDDIPYLDEIAETILPATSTPGAKAAKVGQFMTVIVNDCYEEDDQKTFQEGMTKALRYNPVPRRYEGCIDYKKGEKSFAGLGG